VARRRYSQFVREGVGKESIWAGLKQQIYLGDEKFVKRIQKRAKIQGEELTIPRAQRRPPAATLAAIEARYPERDDAIVAAYKTGSYGYRQIAEHLGVHLATVGRIAGRQMLRCEN
jgi:transposase